jgi:hypothetical protein
MGAENLVFSVVSTGETIYDPLTLDSSLTQTVRVTNFGEEDLEGLGLFIRPSTTLGEVDFPADAPPETDYQDLLTWGQASHLGLAAMGGLKVTVPQNGGSEERYVTRDKGHIKAEKIPFKDLASGESADFVVVLETPPSVSARRLYIDLAIE